ncbi:hypothetical protein LK09_02085 [Microbacterium mangrovi]|uniref:Acetyltransferase n=1 Tax=Microbacterium mangrovi TaxID=1348253 RepID=A0A0B2ACU3_9MICO|nr:acyltransferase [Microbacterium mangrovi]KHK99461.1 hypothetical protein LK09_02085 [Microbacterium mangrovi]
MVTVDRLHEYADDDGNVIESPSEFREGVNVRFRGKNNRLVVHERARIVKLDLTFDGDNGTLILGAGTRDGAIRASIRVGQDSTITFGDNVTMTSTSTISAVEGTSITFGDDVMIASGNQFRADDGHAVYDVVTGGRVNKSRSITIGSHVWFAYGACALGGSVVGDGSVIGFNALVTGRIPNNVIAVGSPAKVVRRNVAWERPHLSLTQPPYRPNADGITKTKKYWKLTEEPVGPVTRAKRVVFARGNRSLVARAKRRAKRLLARKA